MHDLVIRNARIIDPAQAIDRITSIAFLNGKIAALGDDLGPAKEMRDGEGAILTPGLIDLHTHVYWGGTSLGIDAQAFCEANRDVIVGIKVRLGRHTSGVNGMTPFETALQVAEETALPMMVHIDEPPPSYAAVVERLRPGDVLTHCFRPFPIPRWTAKAGCARKFWPRASGG